MTLKKTFIIGLACFLSQASKSIDRAPSNDLSSLVEFYEKTSKYKPRDILQKLESIIRGHGLRRQKLRVILGRLFGLDVRITYPELHIVERAFKRLEGLLSDRTQWQKKMIIDARLEVAYVGALLEDKIHPRFQREPIQKIFHLNHAENLKLKSVETLAGKMWLENATS